MRTGFGLIGLVLAVVVVALMVKKQLSMTLSPPQAMPSVEAVSTSPAGTAIEQSRAIQGQVKQQVEAQMQARPMPDADK